MTPPKKKTSKKTPPKKASNKTGKKTTPKKTHKAHRDQSRKVTARELKIWGALLCLVIFVVVSLALLQQARFLFAPDEPDRSTASVETEMLAFEQARTIFEQALDEVVDGPAVERIHNGDRVTYRIVNEELTQGEAQHLRTVLTAGPGRWRVNRPQPQQLTVSANERWHFELLFVPPPRTAPALVEPVEKGPRVAIIMDDMGNDTFSARELLEIDLAVTFAVLPEMEASTATARLAHEKGREVMLHIPMEPIGYPHPNPGRNPLLSGLTDDEIRLRFASYLQQVPHAVGGNNHMGSRFTQEEEGMRVVLDELAQRHLFFVDSLTTNASVTRRLAAERGVPFGRRDLFLDNIVDVDKIRHELRRLIQLALRDGEAVGIGHPYPETLEALRLEQDSFAAAGVRVVPMSRLIRPLPRS